MNEWDEKCVYKETTGGLARPLQVNRRNIICDGSDFNKTRECSCLPSRITTMNDVRGPANLELNLRNLHLPLGSSM